MTECLIMSCANPCVCGQYEDDWIPATSRGVTGALILTAVAAIVSALALIPLGWGYIQQRKALRRAQTFVGGHAWRALPVSGHVMGQDDASLPTKDDAMSLLTGEHDRFYRRFARWFRLSLYSLPLSLSTTKPTIGTRTPSMER